MFLRNLFLVLAASLSAALICASEDLVGRNASEFEISEWLNSKPLALSDLAGKVVLIRWWTAPHCPYCKATAPALKAFHDKYAERGLVVIGAYHHKSAEPLKTENVKEYAQKYGFNFPIAIDADWKTLKHWWLDGGKRAATSVSFLIDRHGVVRYIHPGPEIAKGSKDYDELDAQIQKLLSEK